MRNISIKLFQRDCLNSCLQIAIFGNQFINRLSLQPKGLDKAIDNANKLIAQYYVAAARGIDDPKTKGEFEQFKKNIVEQLNSDFDFDENGTFTAEGLVDSILQSDRLYSQFYQDVEDALDKVETKTLSHSEKIKDILSNLWNAEGFEDTKKSILELADSLDGITADNINDLVSSSGELAALIINPSGGCNIILCNQLIGIVDCLHRWIKCICIIVISL